MEASRFVGTEPLPAGSRVDPQKLQRYLREHLPDCQGEMTVERFRGGQSNPTMVLAFDGKRKLVLRKKPDGKLLPSAHAVDREYRVICALHGSGVPVARARLLCDDADIVGAMFYIMDYVEGRSLWDPSLPGMTAAERAAIYGEMNRVIAGLHGIDCARVGLEDFGKPNDYVARQVARWTKQYRASETEIIEAMDRLIAWLPDNIPAQHRTSLIHGDFRIDNMIFHPTQAKVLAVVDWELSTLGDPMADFAYHMLTWHFPQRSYRGLADVDLAALGIPHEPAYRAAYLVASGQESVSNRDWYAYLAFCLFRVAAIRQGIMKRVVEGTAASAHAREAGALARPVAELGWRYAQMAMRQQG
ncbi:aminoglycoside phosphotransferase (APT) family kinase protein [Pseudaminobacter salicylatoxidans]|uniref:Aminoglycoside phosphotransferase (APT) family kinase protein n=1 Tax=Pseudaminobacter salicylatoxidans TaxID=93369 RepID=A0A316CEM0_PSESE|nr:phosphotransferase family protein [Pseudaminobacter salicylatoxidans]PWJ86557.1 aminoglycoside phosphotransferase (APT) family kinase protein [Pseudaminobacter salicylatoxidans]